MLIIVNLKYVKKNVKNNIKYFDTKIKKATPTGLEPATFRLTVGCSNHLSYGVVVIIWKMFICLFN